MEKGILTLMLLISIISCSFKKESCFKEQEYNEYKANFNLLDTNCVYVFKLAVSGSDSDLRFIKSTNDMLKEGDQGFRFFANNKFAYYYGNDSISLKNPVIGFYISHNDIIQICRKSYSPQAGNFKAKRLLIIKDSTLIDNVGDNSKFIYVKTTLNKFRK